MARGMRSTTMLVTHAAAKMMETQRDQAKTCGRARFSGNTSWKTRRGAMQIPQPARR
jgi:hypothetical protein